MKLSEKIELIICILEQSKKDCEWSAAALDEENRKKTDILHEMEGAGIDNKTPPKYDQRANLATKLQNTLIARRLAKDAFQINEPLYELVESEFGKTMLNKLKAKLGEVRKEEKNKENRLYAKRSNEQLPQNPTLDALIRDWKRDLKNFYH